MVLNWGTVNVKRHEGKSNYIGDDKKRAILIFKYDCFVSVFVEEEGVSHCRSDGLKLVNCMKSSS